MLNIASNNMPLLHYLRIYGYTRHMSARLEDLFTVVTVVPPRFNGIKEVLPCCGLKPYVRYFR